LRLRLLKQRKRRAATTAPGLDGSGSGGNARTGAVDVPGQ
jgi:hypothetical protein